MAGSAVERSAEAMAAMAARPNAAAVVTQARAVVTAMAAAEAMRRSAAATEAIGCGWAGGAERRRLELDWSGGDARWRRRKRRRRWWWPRSSDGGEGDGDGGDGNGTLDAVRVDACRQAKQKYNHACQIRDGTDREEAGART